MSYTFAICNATLPRDYQPAKEEAFRLQEEPEPNPAVFDELIDQLTARYPCIRDLPDDEIQNGPWCDGPLRQKNYTRTIVFGLIFSRVADVMPFIIETASALGFSIVDWQTGKVHRPKGDINWVEPPAVYMMTEDKARDDVYRHLGVFLAPLGFTLRPDKKRLVRSTGDVLQSIDVGLYSAPLHARLWFYRRGGSVIGTRVLG